MVVIGSIAELEELTGASGVYIFLLSIFQLIYFLSFYISDIIFSITIILRNNIILLPSMILLL
jgi:hypothetical protein